MISKYFQDAQKAKQLLPHLKRGNRIEALVEFVASGSRLRVFIPKESCLVTFLLAGKKLIFFKHTVFILNQSVGYNIIIF